MSTTGESLIPYQELMENALRGLVRETLTRIGESGLPGNHHFFISFHTGADGVVMPAHLRARYPDEMTIVIQHQFWGLETTETSFSVTLSFGGRSERLTIPFRALTAFIDPAVNFGLQFRPTGEAAGADADEAAAPAEPEAAPDTAPDTAKEDVPDGERVVTLDRFRKK